MFEPYDDSHQPVYPLVGSTFRTLAASENLRNIILAFEIKLLAHLGYMPVLDRCAGCGKRIFATEAQSPRESGNGEKLGFSSAAGGILCQRCSLQKQGSLNITQQTAEMLKEFLHTEIGHTPALSLSTGTYQEIKHLLMDHYQYHTGISLKTEKFVQKLRSANLNL